MSWDYVFIITALSPLIALIIIQFLNFEKHENAIKKFKVI